MAKPYIIPMMATTAVGQTLPVATSPNNTPSATVNRSKSVDAGSVEVKGNSQDYDVWDDDWQK